jgi:Winged helix-turn-helix domain (DUF2582)
MEGEIGGAAGVIWEFLDQHGETALNTLKQGTRLSDQMLLMGLGWLAREGKLVLARQGRTLRIGLRERSARELQRCFPGETELARDVGGGLWKLP